MNTQHGRQRIGATTIACFWIEGVNLVFKLLPRNQLIHSTKEEFFASFAAFAGKFGVGEGKLVHERLDS